tara:strand:+ start:1145 stop:1702 length:558 start_codon:yes stop_codon:yes gene_type:complete
MSNFKAALKKVNTFILDIDGVLTNGTVLVLPDGEQVRQFNIKDGYALQLAVKLGYHIEIISGGTSESVRLRLNGLGIEHVNLACKDKMAVFNRCIKQHGLTPENILYVGDDIPDYEVMKAVGIACSPFDAAEEIKSISHYVSPKGGGQGCIRDILEQTMKVQGKWFDPAKFDKETAKGIGHQFGW